MEIERRYSAELAHAPLVEMSNMISLPPCCDRRKGMATTAAIICKTTLPTSMIVSSL
jgi:hypothetical protein